MYKLYGITCTHVMRQTLRDFYAPSTVLALQTQGCLGCRLHIQTAGGLAGHCCYFTGSNYGNSDTIAMMMLLTRIVLAHCTQVMDCLQSLLLVYQLDWRNCVVWGGEDGNQEWKTRNSIKVGKCEGYKSCNKTGRQKTTLHT